MGTQFAIGLAGGAQSARYAPRMCTFASGYLLQATIPGIQILSQLIFLLFEIPAKNSRQSKNIWGDKNVKGRGNLSMHACAWLFHPPFRVFVVYNPQ